MNHFAAYQKLTQHCKSAILQFFKNNPKKKENFCAPKDNMKNVKRQPTVGEKFCKSYI